MTISASGSSVGDIIYAPKATLSYTGSGGLLPTQMIVDQLKLTASGNLSIPYSDYAGSGPGAPKLVE
jgi:hypothetical protein